MNREALARECARPTVEEAMRLIRKMEQCTSPAAKLILLRNFVSSAILSYAEKAEGARDEQWKSAVNKLLDYIEAHGWGTIPEPWDSITPLYDLMYSRCPTCHNLDRRGDRSKRDHARIPEFRCSDAWHDIVRPLPAPPEET